MSNLRFASIGSGSKGNATLVQCGNTCVMIDCGFSTREVEKRLARLDISGEHLDAILVTHEHGDHVRGVARLSRKYRIPVWMTHGTHSHCRQREEYPYLKLFNSHKTFSVETLQIQPFPVPHDAREPVQFVITNGEQRLGILTDTGSVTTHIKTMLNGVHALMLEGNHDLDMLMNGQYSQRLKQRVSSPKGHLSNAQSAELLSSIDCSNLQHLVAVHLSESNNHPEKVQQTFSSALDGVEDMLTLACQEQGFDWIELASQIDS